MNMGFGKIELDTAKAIINSCKGKSPNEMKANKVDKELENN